MRSTPDQPTLPVGITPLGVPLGWLPLLPGSAASQLCRDDRLFAGQLASPLLQVEALMGDSRVLDPLCQQLADLSAGHQSAEIDMVLPGVGPVRISMVTDVMRIDMALNAHRPEGQRWLQRHEQGIRSRLQNYSGKSVRLMWAGRGDGA